MFLPTIIIFKFTNDITKEDILRRIENVSIYNNYESQCVNKTKATYINIKPKFKIFNNYGIIYYASEQEKIKINFYQEDNDKVALCQHFPLGISSVIPDYKNNLNSCLFPLIENLFMNKENLKYMHSPQVLYYVDDSKIRIINDGIGFGRLYEHKTDDGIFWSNRIGSSIIFSESCPNLNEKAMSVYLGLGQFLNKDTAFEGINVVDPGTLIEITNNEINYTNYDCYKFYFNKESDGITTTSVLDKMNNFFTELKSFTSGSYQLGISGGRDSRAILSFFANDKELIPDNLKLFTASPPIIEIELAEQCINKTDLKKYWSTLDRETEQKPDFNLIKRGMNWMKLYDGDFYPGILYNDINLDSLNLPINYIRLSGIAGAAGHPNGVSQNDLKNPTSKLDRFPKGKIKPVWYPHKIMKDQYLSHVVKTIEDKFKEAEIYGLNNLFKFDYWYLKERFRRWSGGNWDVETLTPYLTPYFIKAGINLSFDDKFNAQLHRDIISNNFPAWNEIPFSVEIETKIRQSGDWEQIKKIDKVASRKFLWETDREDFYEIINNLQGEIYDCNLIKNIYKNISNESIALQTQYQKLGLNIVFLDLIKKHKTYLEDFLDTCKKDKIIRNENILECYLNRQSFYNNEEIELKIHSIKSKVNVFIFDYFSSNNNLLSIKEIIQKINENKNDKEKLKYYKDLLNERKQKLHYFDGKQSILHETLNINSEIQNYKTYSSVNGCNWNTTYKFKIPNNWSSGLYTIYIECTEKTGLGFFYVPFILKSNSIKSNNVILMNTNTWCAYNWWTGIDITKKGTKNIAEINRMNSYYAYSLPKSIYNYDDNSSEILSFERPDVRISRGLYNKINIVNKNINAPENRKYLFDHLFIGELHLLEFMKRNNIDFDLVCDSDLHFNYKLIDHKNLITHVHPEYWSKQMWYNLHNFLENGNNLISLGGNFLHRYVELVSHGNDVKQIKRVTNNNLEIHWSDNEIKKHITTKLPKDILGSLFDGRGYGTFCPYQVTDSKHWIFNGTNLKNGDYFGKDCWNVRYSDYLKGKTGASGHETDKCCLLNANNIIVARGTNPQKGVTDNTHKNLNNSINGVDASKWPKNTNFNHGGAEMFYTEDNKKMFFSGSITFTASLNLDKNVEIILLNVLKKFNS